jgi:opacity protein-like surface antigen
MKKLTYLFVVTLLASLFVGATRVVHAQRPQNSFDASVMYTELHANAPVGGCGCFWMEGGSGEIAIPLWRNFSGVMQVNGETTGNIPTFNVGLSLLTGLGGLRMRIPNHTRFQPYGEGLFGGVHGFDSYFPARLGKLPTSYDTSFALAVGGGLDIAVSRHIWIRAIQADYHYSELRNLQGDRQNQFRLGAGVVFRSAGK